MSGYWGTPPVIPVTLASPSDFATWTGTTAPANITAILRSCTSLVLDATETAYYTVDSTTGLATDPIILAAMRDATCIQAAAWVALAIDPLLGGTATATVKTSKKIGSAAFTISDADAAAANAARTAAMTELVPDAFRKLQQLNLLGDSPYMI